MRGVLFALLLAVLPVEVLSHDLANWINQGGYKNAAGQYCCGENDCKELAHSDVQITPSGYLILSLNEVVPFSEAQPSPDGYYWRCAWGMPRPVRKCFFAPPGST